MYINYNLDSDGLKFYYALFNQIMSEAMEQINLMMALCFNIFIHQYDIEIKVVVAVSE